MAEEDRLKRKIRQENQTRDNLTEAWSAELERLVSGAVRVAIAPEGPGVDTALIDAGIEEQLSILEELYGVELSFVVDEFGRLTDEPPFIEEDIDAAEILMEAEIEKVAGRVSNIATDLQAEIARSIFLDQEPDLERLASRAGRTVSQIKTEVNTGMAAFNRTFTVRKAKDAFGENPKFIYIGPNDDVTRDFCRGVLLDRSPPVYTLKEIEAMDNKQDLPVLTTGGGFNCRHDWRPFGN